MDPQLKKNKEKKIKELIDLQKSKVFQAHKSQPRFPPPPTPPPPGPRPPTTSLWCGLAARLGVVTSVAPGCRRGGNAVVLDGMQLRPSTYMGGTSSRAQACSWTQRQLSIKEGQPAFTLWTVRVGVGWGGKSVPLQKQK